MSAVALDLLAEAHRYGVRLIATPAGTIKARAPKAPPLELLAKLKSHRAELVAALGAADTAIAHGSDVPMNAEDRQGSAKTANEKVWRPSAELAVVGIGARCSVPAEWSAGHARLDPNLPPPEVPPKRWLQFVDDCGRFLDSPFCAVAAALDWSPLDLFGADRDKPFARIDQAGLLWLLNGDRLVMLSEHSATIVTKTGRHPSYRRKPSGPGRCLAWDLVGDQPA
jgi:hypothetical protein